MTNNKPVINCCIWLVDLFECVCYIERVTFGQNCDVAGSAAWWRRV